MAAVLNDTPYNNAFTKGICILGVAWVGSIIFRKFDNDTNPSQRHNANKRYKVLQQTKLNQNIEHKNRNAIHRKRPNFKKRHKRFNR